MGPRLKEFLRAQVSAFVGGTFDFSIYFFCHTILGIPAHFANAISGALGAVVNFTINRYWSFSSTKNSVGSQLWKFVIVVMGSILLKSTGIYLLIDIYHFHYLLSKLTVELIVSLGFNFVLQRHWVFKKK